MCDSSRLARNEIVFAPVQRSPSAVEDPVVATLLAASHLYYAECSVLHEREAGAIA